MSIFRSVVTAGLLCSAAAYGQTLTVDLTAPVVLDDFNDGYGDAPNQNTIGAAYGIISQGGKPWLGGGYWYFFQDNNGSSVTNSAKEQIVAATNEASMVPDSTLYVNLKTSPVDSTLYPYAGVGCVLAGPGNGNYLDLSKMTAVSLKVKGTGTVRMHFETKDIADSLYDWGWYGYIINLTSSWTTINIPVASLVPELYSKPANNKWTWAHGKSAVNKLAFQVKNGKDAELHVDDIKLVGMTYGDFKFPASHVLSFKTAKNGNVFSVNASTISFKLKQSQDMTVSLTDMMGNQIRSLYTGKSAAQTINLNDKNIASGRYMVVINGKDANFTQPIVITK